MNKNNNPLLLIEWFNKVGCTIVVGDEEITTLSMKEICEILDLDIETYPLIGQGQIITEEKGKKLQKYIKHKFNFEKFEYFIESIRKN